MFGSKGYPAMTRIVKPSSWVGVRIGGCAVTKCWRPCQLVTIQRSVIYALNQKLECLSRWKIIN